MIPMFFDNDERLVMRTQQKDSYTETEWAARRDEYKDCITELSWLKFAPIQADINIAHSKISQLEAYASFDLATIEAKYQRVKLDKDEMSSEAMYTQTQSPTNGKLTVADKEAVAMIYLKGIDYAGTGMNVYDFFKLVQDRYVFIKQIYSDIKSFSDKVTQQGSMVKDQSRMVPIGP